MGLLKGEIKMKCVICKNGNTKNELITVSLEYNKKTFVFKEVPARVFENCGEQYLEGFYSIRGGIEISS